MLASGQLAVPTDVLNILAPEESMISSSANLVFFACVKLKFQAGTQCLHITTIECKF